MKISTKGRYALRLMADIGAHDQSGCVSLRDVAARQEISVKYLEQIAGMLTKAGFLYSERGAQGGYRLSRAPEEYTVGSILRLTEGDLAPVACLEGPENRCRRCGECTTLDFWTESVPKSHRDVVVRKLPWHASARFCSLKTL